MTATQKNLLLGAAGGAAIGWGVGLIPAARGYEDGIRVKNGSIVLTTLSGEGFEQHGNGYRTQLKTHGCYTVVVVGGECEGGVRDLDQVKKIAFQGDDNRPQEADDEAGGKKFKVKDGTNWSLESNRTVLRYTAAYLASFSAAAGNSRLSCVGSATNPLSVWLTSTECK